MRKAVGGSTLTISAQNPRDLTITYYTNSVSGELGATLTAAWSSAG